MFPFGGSSSGATRPPPRRPSRTPIPTQGVPCLRAPSPVVAWDARRHLPRPVPSRAPSPAVASCPPGFGRSTGHDGEAGSSGDAAPVPSLEPWPETALDYWPQSLARANGGPAQPGLGRTTAHDGEAGSSSHAAPVPSREPWPETALDYWPQSLARADYGEAGSSRSTASFRAPSPINYRAPSSMTAWDLRQLSDRHDGVSDAYGRARARLRAPSPVSASLATQRVARSDGETPAQVQTPGMPRPPVAAWKRHARASDDHTA
jgi:hypothetical protein